MTTLPKYACKVEELVHTPRTSEWCRLPYYNHPKGCPEWGRKDGCPPNAPYITDVLDTSRPVYLIHSEFDLESWEARMGVKHPDWSRWQRRCVLYWQEKSRKQLRERVRVVAYQVRPTLITMCPEGMGVNVLTTARKAGIPIEVGYRDMKVCRHVALVGWRKRKHAR